MEKGMIRPIDQSDWAVMREQAKVLIGTGFLPDAIKTAEQAIAIMMKARELGLPPMYGLSNIVVIKGKPAASAELMLALIYRDHGDDAIRFLETNAERCVIGYKRRSWKDYSQHSFTIKDAEAAGLLINDTWKKYRPAMLRARCISAVARMGYPDSIGGLYTPEELGATVQMSDTEEIVVVPPAADVHVNGPPVEIIKAAEIQEARQNKESNQTKRAAWDKRYDDIRERGLAVGVDIEERNPMWSDAEEIAKGTEAAKLVHAGEEKEFAKASSG